MFVRIVPILVLHRRPRVPGSMEATSIVTRGGFYTPKKRPSGHNISAGFGKDNGGAIPSNLLSISNTDSNSNYFRLCKELGLERHPARFPSDLPAFFIKMLTDEEDVVLDIFGGSNTTGFTAEALKRKWLTFEMNPEYLAASAFRFLEGHSFEAVRKVLGELNDSQADFLIDATVCALDPTKKPKLKNESLGQRALFVSRAEAPHQLQQAQPHGQPPQCWAAPGP
ncbi:MAG: DNA methyltransferase [Polaromonas sp.]